MTAVGRWQSLDELMDEALVAGVFPGAQLIVGRGDDIVLESAYGVLAERDCPVTSTTRYDISSLTKPLATLSSLLVLVSRGLVRLDTLVTDVLPEFADSAHSGASLERERSSIRIRDLLGHCSGLPAHRRYYQESSEASLAPRERICELACREPLECRPRTAAVYSDVGFIVLGAVVERLSGDGLDRFAASSVFDPMGLEATGFIRLTGSALDPSAAAGIAPCGRCSWRGSVLRGVVQDENAYAMNGVAGHAGLFSTATEVHTIVAHYIRAFHRRSSIFEPGLVEACWCLPDGSVADSTWALGWDTPSARRSSAGSLVSRRSFGHLGFTGTSIWIDIERGVHVIVLSNRVHSDPDNTRIRELRPRLHDAVFAAID